MGTEPSSRCDERGTVKMPNSTYIFSPRTYQPGCLPADDEFDRQVTENKAVVARIQCIQGKDKSSGDKPRVLIPDAPEDDEPDCIIYLPHLRPENEPEKYIDPEIKKLLDDYVKDK